MHPHQVPASCIRFCLTSLLLAGITLAACGHAWAADGVKAPGDRNWGVSFGGFGMSGRVTTALLPEGGDDYADMNPIERPFGFGLSIDYKLAPNMRLFLDGNVTTYRKQVGIEGEYSTSFWVYEMTGYESHIIGPFTDDAYYYMDTTGMRLGLKYDFPAKGFRPWVGAGFGIYSWKADYATADHSASWGSDSGTVAGATFLCGVDFFIGSGSMITIFGDFTSPVANPVIEDLFQDGWTWDNSGGSHVMGPYRFGISFGLLK